MLETETSEQQSRLQTIRKEPHASRPCATTINAQPAPHFSCDLLFTDSAESMFAIPYFQDPDYISSLKNFPYASDQLSCIHPQSHIELPLPVTSGTSLLAPPSSSQPLLQQLEAGEVADMGKGRNSEADQQGNLQHTKNDGRAVSSCRRAPHWAGRAGWK